MFSLLFYYIYNNNNNTHIKIITNMMIIIILLMSRSNIEMDGLMNITIIEKRKKEEEAKQIS